MAVSVYVESSVISYLTARPGRDLITAARQAITTEWWSERREKYEVLISVLVEEEISRGDAQAAEQRLAAVADIASVNISEAARELAEELIRSNAVPENSRVDALHIALAATNGIDYLLTWNFRHINNAETKAVITEVVEQQGLACPVLCSPEELGAK